MRHALAACLALALAATPALAESRRADTVITCFNGFCTRTERLVIEDRWGRRGWERHRAWEEEDDDDDDDDERGWRRHRGFPPAGAVIILPPIILGR